MAQEDIDIKISIETGQARSGLGKLTQEMKRVKEESGGVGKAIKETESAFSKFGAAVVSLNQGIELANRVFGSISRAFKSMASSAIQAQTAVAEIQTLLDGAAGSTVDFQDEIDKLRTRFGGTLQDQAKGFYQILSAGAADAAHAAELLATANKLAVGGVTSVENAVDGLANVLKAYNLDASEAARVSDVLFIGMKAGRTTIGELSASMGKLLPTASAFGISFEEAVAAVSALTTAGIDTRRSVTAIQAAIISLTKPTEATKAVLEELGITSIKSAFQTDGFVNTLRRVAATAGDSAEGLTELFSAQEALPAVTSFAGDSINATFQNIQRTVEQANESIGRTSEEAANKLLETSGSRLDRLQARFDIAFRKIGEIILEVLVPPMEMLGELFTRTFDQMQETVARFQRFVAAVDWDAILIVAVPAITLLAAAITTQLIGALTALGTTLTTVVIPAMMKLIVAMAPIILKVAAVVAVFILAEKAGQALEAAWQGLQLLVVGLAAAIVDLANRIPFLTGKFEGLRTELNALAEEQGHAVAMAGRRVVSTESVITSAFDSIKSGLAAWNDESDKTAETLEKINTAGEKLKTTIPAIPPPRIDAKTLEQALQKFEQLADAVKRYGATSLQASMNTVKARLAEIDALEKQLKVGKKLTAERKAALDAARDIARSEGAQALLDATEAAQSQVAKLLENNTEVARIEAGKQQRVLQEQLADGLITYEQFAAARQALEKQVADTAISEQERVEAEQKRKALQGASTAGAAAVGGGAGSALQGVTDAMQMAGSMVSGAASALLGPIAAAQGIVNVAQQVVDAVPQLINSFAGLLDSITDLPMVLLDAVQNLARAIPRLVSEFIPNILKAIPEIVDTLIQALLIDLPDAFLALSEAIPRAVESLIDRIPEIAQKLVFGLITQIPKLVLSFVNQLVNGTPRIIKALIRAIPQLVEALVNGVIEAFLSIGDLIGDIFTGGVGDMLAAPVQAIEDSITGIGEQVFSVLDLKAGARGLDIADRISDAISGATNRAAAILQKLWNFLKAIWDGVGNMLQHAFDNIKATWDLMMSAATIVWNAIWDLGKAVFSFGADLLTGAWNYAKDIFNAIVGWLKSAWDIAGDLFDGIVDALKGVWDFAVAILKVPIDLFMAMWNFVKTLFDDPIAAFEGLWEDLTGIFDDIFSAFSDLFDTFADLGATIWKSFTDAVTAAGDFFGDAGAAMWKALKSGLGSVGDFFKGVGKVVIDSISSAIDSAGNFLAEIFSFDGGGKGTVENFLGFDFPWFAFAEGGQVPGRARIPGDSLLNDTVPALLSPGEIVLPRSVVEGGPDAITKFLKKLGGRDKGIDKGAGQMVALLESLGIGPMNRANVLDSVLSGASKLGTSALDAVLGLPDQLLKVASTVIEVGGNVNLAKLLSDPMGAVKGGLRGATGFLGDIFKGMMAGNFGLQGAGSFETGIMDLFKQGLGSAADYARATISNILEQVFASASSMGGVSVGGALEAAGIPQYGKAGQTLRIPTDADRAARALQDAEKVAAVQRAELGFLKFPNMMTARSLKSFALSAYGASNLTDPGGMEFTRLKDLVISQGFPFANGGLVPGSGTRDSVPAMLTPGEFVINRQATNDIGLGVLGRLNSGGGIGDQTINITINTTQPVDEAFIRNRIIPEVKTQLRRDSLNGRRVVAQAGVR